MAKYIFRTTATMKPYNNKNWWIDGDIIPAKRNFNGIPGNGLHNI